MKSGATVNICMKSLLSENTQIERSRKLKIEWKNKCKIKRILAALNEKWTENILSISKKRWVLVDIIEQTVTKMIKTVANVWNRKL